MIEIVDRFQIQTKIKVFYYYDYRAQTNFLEGITLPENMIQLMIVYIVIIFQAKRNSSSSFMQID